MCIFIHLWDTEESLMVVEIKVPCYHMGKKENKKREIKPNSI
jgi:hypothetical protein